MSLVGDLEEMAGRVACNALEANAGLCVGGPLNGQVLTHRGSAFRMQRLVYGPDRPLIAERIYRFHRMADGTFAWVFEG